jgi:mitochondrial fission protein ELM1
MKSKRRKILILHKGGRVLTWCEDLLTRTTDRGGWELTDSRRTPVRFLDQVREKLPRVTAIFHTETPPGWVPEKLRQANGVWVTEDSASMIYEAITSGAKVGLLPVPRVLKDSGFGAHGIPREYVDRERTRRLVTQAEPVNEAERRAGLTTRYLFHQDHLQPRSNCRDD